MVSLWSRYAEQLSSDPLHYKAVTNIVPRMPLRPSIPGTSSIALHSVMRSILCTARLSTFYSSLLLSNCRLRIAQPYTGFRSSISIPNCAPQHAQLCTVSLDFLLVPYYSFPFLPCASQHFAVQHSL